MLPTAWVCKQRSRVSSIGFPRWDVEVWSLSPASLHLTVDCGRPVLFHYCLQNVEMIRRWCIFDFRIKIDLCFRKLNASTQLVPVLLKTYVCFLSPPLDLPSFLHHISPLIWLWPFTHLQNSSTDSLVVHVCVCVCDSYRRACKKTLQKRPAAARLVRFTIYQCRTACGCICSTTAAISPCVHSSAIMCVCDQGR